MAVTGRPSFSFSSFSPSSQHKDKEEDNAADPKASKETLKSDNAPKKRKRPNEWRRYGSKKTRKTPPPRKIIINKKNQSLKPIPFNPPPTLDLHEHADVLKQFGLYDFSKLKLDREIIKTDLLVQLINSYDPKKRCSYVNGKRINVTKAHFAKALHLPLKLKRDKSVRLEFSDEAVGFLEDFVVNWVVIHNVGSHEMVNWTSCIRDGHPENLDPASLIWYNAERELSQGDEFGYVYYASHFQQLIRSQKPQLFKEEDEDFGGSVEQVEHEEVSKADEMMLDGEKVVGDIKEQGVHLSSGFNKPFLQRCGLTEYDQMKVENNRREQVEEGDAEIQVVEAEEEEEGVGERFDDLMDRDGVTDSFHQGVETSHTPCASHRITTVDLFGSEDDDSFLSHHGPSFLDNGGKRVMEAEEEIHHYDGNTKRLNINDNSFGSCMVKMQQVMEKAKMLCMSKENNFLDLKHRLELAKIELQQQNQIMEMNIKSRDEELLKKHNEVFRLKRELHLMEDCYVGYKKALADTRFKFSEYRKRAALHEEPLYKDAGPGGLVLSTRELALSRKEFSPHGMMKHGKWSS